MLVKSNKRSKVTYQTVFNDFKAIGYCSFRIVDDNSQQELSCAIMKKSAKENSCFTFRIYNSEVNASYEYPLVFEYDNTKGILYYEMQVNQHLQKHSGIDFSINHVLKRFAKMYETYHMIDLSRKA